MYVIELDRQDNGIERKEKGMKILYGRILMYHRKCCDCGMGGTWTGDDRITDRQNVHQGEQLWERGIHFFIFLLVLVLLLFCDIMKINAMNEIGACCSYVDQMMEYTLCRRQPVS